MNKKRIIILTIIGVLIVGSIIGVMCYRNTPGYVMKQYVKAYNEKDYKSLQKYVYNYDTEIKLLDFTKNIFEVKINSYSLSKQIHHDEVNDWLNQFYPNHIYDNIIDKGCEYNINYDYWYANGNKNHIYNSKDSKKENQVVGIGKVGYKWMIVWGNLDYLHGFNNEE